MDTSSLTLKLAELFKFTLKDGTILRYTSYPHDITFGGNLFTAAPINRSPVTQDSDMSASEERITVPRVSPWLDVDNLMQRYLDNAEVEVTIVDRTNDANCRVVFIGKTGEVVFTHNYVEVTFKNILDLFSKKIPRRKYMEGCGHTMYDRLCKLVRTDWEVNGTVDAGSTTTQIVDAGITEADNYFNLGIIEFTSGNLSGIKRWIKGYTVGNVYLFDALPEAPAVGDAFNLVPHCNKTYAACRDDYGNEINFGGFQDIPDPTEAYT